jgi:hypothetical protein
LHRMAGAPLHEGLADAAALVLRQNGNGVHFDGVGVGAADEIRDSSVIGLDGDRVRASVVVEQRQFIWELARLDTAQGCA